MVEIENKIKEIVERFIEEVRKDNITISKAYLFGSYANGTNHEFSDIDIAIVSDNFEGINFYDCQKVVEAMLRTNVDLETHPYRPEDFTEDNPFVKEILDHGIRIV
ncbi:nucleotidyltransferase domain-containing protein [Bacteroidota bacterium]